MYDKADDDDERKTVSNHSKNESFRDVQFRETAVRFQLHFIFCLQMLLLLPLVLLTITFIFHVPNDNNDVDVDLLLTLAPSAAD